MRSTRSVILLGLVGVLLFGMVSNAGATPGSPPAITSAASATFYEGSASTFTVTTTGSPTSALSQTGALPSGITFTDNGDGTATLAGTPSGSGSYPLSITAANGALPDATQSFTLTVIGLFDAHIDMSVVGSGGGTVTDNSASLTTGPNGQAPCSSTSVGHTHCWNYSVRGDETYTVTATPDPGSVFLGWDPFFPGPCAGSMNPVCSFTPTTNSNDRANFGQPVAPNITSADNTAFTVGVPGTFTVTTSGAPVATVSESGVLPAGVTLTDNGDGTATLAGTPAAGSGGTYPLTMHAANGTTPDASQSFTLTIGFYQPELGIASAGHAPGSTAKVEIRQGGNANFDLHITNASNLSDTFALRVDRSAIVLPSSPEVRGPVPKPAWNRFYLTFTDGSTDISAQVQDGTFLTPVLAPGQELVVHLRVRLARNAVLGVKKFWDLFVTSEGDPAFTAGAQLVVRCKR